MSTNVMFPCMDQLLEVISILCGRSVETNVPNPRSSFYIDADSCDLCVVALARTTTVVAIPQRLQSGKSLDSGLERLYITLNSLKYNICIASQNFS